MKLSEKVYQEEKFSFKNDGVNFDKFQRFQQFISLFFILFLKNAVFVEIV